MKALPTNDILVVDAVAGASQLLDNSIDCIVTSPPYWSLRDYDNKKQIPPPTL